MPGELGLGLVTHPSLLFITHPVGLVTHSLITSCRNMLTTTTATNNQVEGLIYFEDSLEQLVQWDKQVASVCMKVDSILDTLSASTAANGAAAPAAMA